MAKGVPAHRRSVGSLCFIAVALILCPADQAPAQGLFDFLFGRLADTSSSTHESQSREIGKANTAPSKRQSSAGGSHGAANAYCVRLCDGRYFPVSKNQISTRADMCSSLCPASPTKVFRGSGLDHAVTSDGTRYAKLGNAFVYRERVVPGCTCNGRSSFGLASIAVDADPTLRAGDAVATAEGANVFTGKSTKDPSARPGFVPVTNDEGRLSDIRRTLTSSRLAQSAR